MAVTDEAIQKIKAMIGWEPQVSVEEGIRRLIEWHREQAD